MSIFQNPGYPSGVFRHLVAPIFVLGLSMPTFASGGPTSDGGGLRGTVVLKDGNTEVSFEGDRRASGWFAQRVTWRRAGRVISQATAWVNDEVIVTVSADELPKVLENLGLKMVRPLMPSAGLYLARVPAGKTALDVSDARVFPNLAFRRKLASIPVPPNDPRHSGQWYQTKIDAEKAWQISSGSSDTTIVVIDNGCDLTHPDLASKLDQGRDVADRDTDPSYAPNAQGNNHGTACASIVGAATNNGEGIAGTCPECRVRCVRMLSDDPVPVSADVDAFQFALDVDADVVSNSWGFVEHVPVPRALETAITTVGTQARGGLGAIVVFAAGNDDRELFEDELYAIEEVVTVGALNNFDEAASFSNFGSTVDVTAPAGTLAADIHGPDGDNAGDYTSTFGGTSSSCPVVAGVAGLLVSYAPTRTAAEIREAMVSSARTAPYATPDSSGHDLVYGYGIIDAYESLLALGASPLVPDAGVVDSGASLDSGLADAADATTAFPDAATDAGTTDAAAPDAGVTTEDEDNCGCQSVHRDVGRGDLASCLLALAVVTLIRSRKKLLPLLFTACGTTPPPAAPVVAQEVPWVAEVPVGERKAPTPFAADPAESHLKDLVQLTFGGENAEAYWSMDGKQLIMQSRFGDMGCDRIVRMDVDKGLPSLSPVSNGFGATTCSYFLPGDQEVVYASTHLGAKECPPKPDMSQGYVWALYDTFDIFRANADGSNVRRLTETPGYDAEATVCKKDGSIVFTSVRDGDIELYRMDADGKNVKRLTNTPGYDGGAFFSDDCSKLIWRASRPKAGAELDDFRKLLGQGLVRPSKLELYIANADGSDPVQVTYLNAATFGPYLFPDGKRIIFSSNYGDPKGREFDLWMINIDGTGLERVTKAGGFDGFPMFSPDGTKLVFASNRATAQGARDTNVFVATWVDGPSAATAGAAERIKSDVTWLADPAREGRGVGTKGLEEAAAWIEQTFKSIGLTPAGTRGFRNEFKVVTKLTVDPKTSLTFDGKAGEGTPLGFSKQGSVSGQVVLAGYGVSDKTLGIDDYAGLDVKGKVVVVRRFVKDGAPFDTTDNKRRFGDIRLKSWTARERGAKALVVVDWPVSTSTTGKLPDEAPLPSLEPEGAQDAGILVVAVKRSALEAIWPKLEKKEAVTAKLTVSMKAEQTTAFNLVGRLSAGRKAVGPSIVVGAHYDHLGYGGPASLAPDKKAPHLGADDNASGTSTMLEVARTLAGKRAELERDVYFIAFSAEESGILGSTNLMQKPPKGLGAKDLMAMLNLDMVGRMRSNGLSVLGGASANEWVEIVGKACDEARVRCDTSGDGYGPSDHTPFYAAGVPVLHFFTGAHNEYHKPSDRAELINAVGAAKVGEIVSGVALALSARKQPLTYNSMPSPTPRGDLRSFNASLGTVPNYVGHPSQPGVLLDGVRPGSAAEQAGMRRGDVLVKLGNHDITSVSDLMFVLNSSKPGESVTARVIRDGKPVELEVTFQESRRPR